MPDYDYLFKVILVGDSGVGKSCLMNAYATGSGCDPTQHTATTVGVDFKMKTMVLDGSRIRIQIWDTAGQDKYRTITSCYYRGANGVMVVYDVCDSQSFTHVRNWLTEVNHYCDPQTSKVKVILVGNKSDKPLHMRAVENDQVKEYASELELDYVETSAFECVNVELAFETLIRHILDAKRSKTEAGGDAKHSTSHEA